MGILIAILSVVFGIILLIAVVFYAAIAIFTRENIPSVHDEKSVLGLLGLPQYQKENFIRSWKRSHKMMLLSQSNLMAISAGIFLIFFVLNVLDVGSISFVGSLVCLCLAFYALYRARKIVI